ncbi:cation/H(+) antiporter 4-like [Cornus florida]|uniref:cation/H(+) antiporter 4-like n=1 Tax=Cornus florida TaxID=4283 RepID=UPI0028A1E846|nr:cation/H(+) antiporter 4-like [Cornus florida]
MGDIYELIMVGRLHRLDSPIVSGLLEWAEFPELGAIGNVLASPDISTSFSLGGATTAGIILGPTVEDALYPEEGCAFDAIPLGYTLIISENDFGDFYFHHCVRALPIVSVDYPTASRRETGKEQCTSVSFASRYLPQPLPLTTRDICQFRINTGEKAGILLGPTFLGQIPGFTETLFPTKGNKYLDVLGKTGFMLFMFLVGVKMEPSMVMRTGKKVWALGFVSVFVQVFVGMTVMSKVDDYISFTVSASFKYTILTQTLSPFAVVSCLLNDLKITNTEVGRVALATGLVRELLNLAVHTPLNYVRISKLGGSAMVGGKALFLYILLILAVSYIMQPVYLWIIRKTPEGKPVDPVYIAFISCGVLLSAIACDFVGTRMYYFGPLILGLTIPVGPPLGSTLVERFDTISAGFLTPVLMTFCGMKTNFLVIQNFRIIYLLWTILFFGTLTKFAGSFLPLLMWKMPLKEAITLALILSTQGIVEIAGLHNYTRNQKLSLPPQIEAQTINEETFSIVTLSVLLIAVIVPCLVRLLYDYSRIYRGYQKRNILHTPNNAELRIFVCVHRQDEALTAIKLLEASNPTRESPLLVHVLHLMELKGRATPLLINHKFGQKITTASHSQSRHIIDIFNYYEHQFLGLVNVQAFTAISMPEFMHHDICSLAFDKLASLIILPFHRKWNSQGNMIVDNNILRSINLQVMELAPCSVGILVDRRKMRQRTTPLYRVAVLFFGGEDDREALAYAKRMAKSSSVHLTVLRLEAVENIGEDNWETVLDTENLKDIRLQSSLRGNVMYKEEKVRDGPGTILIIRSMGENCDLIMVGRQHRLDSPLLSGLLEWAHELPELGAIGNLLISPDIRQPVSVLVVQQQHTKSKLP